MEIEEEKLDILREIAHVGAGNASTSLSKMTGRKIEVAFPKIEMREIREVPDMLGGASRTVSAVLLDVEMSEDSESELEPMGTLLLTMDRDSAKTLASVVTQQEENSEELTDMGVSALKEIGNILAGSCLSAITEYVELQLTEGLPYFKEDMLGAIVDRLLLEIAKEHDEVLVFKTEFSFEEEVDAYFIFLFRPQTHVSIIDRLSV